VPLAEDLLAHSEKLISSQPASHVDCRRAVSAAYYAAFHLISAAIARQVSPPEPIGLRGRSQRALEHSAMKSAMSRFLTTESVGKLVEQIRVPCVFSQDIAMIAKTFGELQDERHLADYDVVDFEGKVGLPWASNNLDKAKLVFTAWGRVQSSDEARLFLASIMFGNKWAK